MKRIAPETSFLPPLAVVGASAVEYEKSSRGLVKSGVKPSRNPSQTTKASSAWRAA